MLAKRIIPCLDLEKGRVVKGVNFVNLIDAGDPVEAATAYDRAGADEIVFLDITASHEGREITLDVVRRTADRVDRLAAGQPELEHSQDHSRPKPGLGSPRGRGIHHGGGAHAAGSIVA